MSEVEGGTAQAQQPQTRRQRAFLGPLPDDFLAPTTAQAYPQPAHGHPQGQYRLVSVLSRSITI